MLVNAHAADNDAALDRIVTAENGGRVRLAGAAGAATERGSGGRETGAGAIRFCAACLARIWQRKDTRWKPKHADLSNLSAFGATLWLVNLRSRRGALMSERRSHSCFSSGLASAESEKQDHQDRGMLVHGA